MALPAILRAASSVKSGTNRLIVASRLNKVANSPIVSGIARASGADRIPALNNVASYLSKVTPSSRPDREEKDDESSAKRNRRKARDDAEKNKARQDQAEKEAVKSDSEGASLLKVIAKDTVRVRDAVESLVKKTGDVKEGGKGLIGGLLSSLTSMLPALLGGGKGLLGAAALGRATGPLSRLGGSVLKAGGRLLGMGGAGAAAAGGVGRIAATTVPKAAAAAGRHTLRDPVTGRFISRAAAAQAAQAAAPKGILARGAAAASGAGAAASRVARNGGGALGRGIAKAGGKSLLKKIPVIGAIAGLGFAANRAMAGDWKGAGLEAASGIVGTVPGLGTAASVGLDAALLARDMKNEEDAATPTSSPSPAPVAAKATPVAPRRGRVAAPTAQALSVQSILSKMLDAMLDENKGIYTRPAKDKTVSSLSRLIEQSNTYTPSRSQPSGSSIGPRTAGIGDSTSGRSMHAGPAPGSDGLGSLSAHYESGRLGSEAVGWDSTGGTSYGKYQIASKTGTMKQFMSYLKENNPAAYEKLSAAGDPDAGKDGEFARTWKQLAKDGTLGNSEHDFIKKTHYDVSYNKIKSEGLKGMIQGSSALQDVLWSSSVQHGGSGGANIFNKVYREGMSEQDLIKAVYAERGTRFKSSTPQVRASVQNRFADESQRALAAVGNSPTGMVRETAVARQQQKQAPVIVNAPTQVASNQGKGANPSRSTPSNTPMIVRNPDSPVRANVNALIRTA